jgi:hypothetical protein
MKRSADAASLEEEETVRIKFYFCTGPTLVDMTETLSNHSGMIRDGYLCSQDAEDTRICLHAPSIQHCTGPNNCIPYDMRPNMHVVLELISDIIHEKTSSVSTLISVNLPSILCLVDFLILDKHLVSAFSGRNCSVLQTTLLREDLSERVHFVLLKSLFYLMEREYDNKLIKDFGSLMRAKFHISSDYIRHELGDITMFNVNDTNEKAHINMRQEMADICMAEDLRTSFKIALVHEIACDDSIFYYNYTTTTATNPRLESEGFPSFLFRYLEKNEAVVAGGAAMRLHPLAQTWIKKTPMSDIDFFLLDHKGRLDKAMNMAHDLEKNDYKMTRLGESVLCFRHDTNIPIQIILSNCKTTKELLETFDLTAAKTAFDGKCLICPFATNKQMFERTITKGGFIPLSGARLLKMVSKGFSLGPTLQGLVNEYKANGNQETKIMESEMKICDIKSTCPETQMKSLKISNYKAVPNASLSPKLCKVEDFRELTKDGLLTVDYSAILPNGQYDFLRVLATITYLKEKVKPDVYHILPLSSGNSVFDLPVSWSRFTTVDMRRMQVIHSSDYTDFSYVCQKVLLQFGASENNSIQPRTYPDVLIKTDINTIIYINGVLSTSNDIPPQAMMRATASIYGISVIASTYSSNVDCELLFLAREIRCVVE